MNKYIEEFLNGNPIWFGTETNGIETLAKLYENREEFYKDYCDKISEEFDIKDFDEIQVYYSDSLRVEKPFTLGITLFNKNYSDLQIIGTFYGLEY